MHPSTFINALFLCLLNVSFMVAGIFLNSVVIISLRKSSQLRKNLGYFMIFVLSCFDLIAVATAHPVLILSTILWSSQHIQEDVNVKHAWEHIHILTAAFSMFALLTLNIERFIALKYPFFHHTAVSKRRLVFFLAFMMMTQILLSPLHHFYRNPLRNILIAGFVLLLMLVFAYLNYEMLMIARSKRKNETVSPSDTSRKERKRHKITFKNISTCSLTVACFFICSLPQIVYSALRVRSETSMNDSDNQLFNLWSNTFASFNFTFNCLIFFWRNSILRREGMKIAKCLMIA